MRLFFLLAVALRAQTITFAPQPQELTRIAWGRIGPRLETWQVTACTTGPALPIPAGMVYQVAAQHGLVMLDRSMTLVAILRGVRRHPAAVAAQIVAYVGLAASLATGTGAVASNGAWKAGIALGAILADKAGGMLAQEIPVDRIQRYGDEVLTDKLELPAGGCQSKVVFAARKRGAVPFSEPLAMPE